MSRIVIHAAILSLVASAFAAITMQINPRMRRPGGNDAAAFAERRPPDLVIDL